MRGHEVLVRQLHALVQATLLFLAPCAVSSWADITVYILRAAANTR